MANLFTKAWKGFVGANKLVFSAIPGVGNYLSQQEANAENKRLVEKTNAANLDLWNRQNAYNTPVEQMKRLEAAGLSPQLAYGQVADSKAGSAPSMEAPQVEPARIRGEDLVSTLAMYQQVLNAAEANKGIRYENAMKAENAKYLKYENKYLMDHGLIKGDNQFLKSGGRVGDYVRSFNEYTHNSSLWQSIMSGIENFMNKHSQYTGRTPYVRMQKVNRR